MVVDFLAQGRLYFSDNRQVYLSNFDGSGVTVVPVSPSRSPLSGLYARNGRSFDVFEQYIHGIFTDSLYRDSNILFRVDKFGRQVAVNQTSLFARSSSLRIYHPYKAGPSNKWPKPCDKLQCSHMCLVTGEGKAKCACPDGAEFARDSEVACNVKKDAPRAHPITCKQECKEHLGTCKYDSGSEQYYCSCHPGKSGPYCEDTDAEIMAHVAGDSRNGNVNQLSGGGNSNFMVPFIIILALFLLLVIGVFIGFLYWKRCHAGGINGDFQMRRLQEEPHGAPSGPIVQMKSIITPDDDFGFSNPIHDSDGGITPGGLDSGRATSLSSSVRSLEHQGPNNGEVL